VERTKRILIIVDPQTPVPPPKYGGTERMADILAEGLSERGYIVDLLAGKNSKTYSGRTFFHGTPGRSFPSRAFTKIIFQFKSLWISRRSDVVINFGRIDYLIGILKLTDKKIVCRFDCPIDQEQVDWLEARRVSNMFFVGISRSQVSTLIQKKNFTIIYNCVDIKKYQYHSEPGDYLVFLGILSYNKGADIAIKAAIQANIKIKVAGKIPDDLFNNSYFISYIKPLLTHPLVEYIGLVNDEEKNHLLGHAACTLFPIRKAEAFGLVMVESLACGTPIIAPNVFSIPEIIIDGFNGYIYNEEEEIVSLVGKLEKINRAECRRDVGIRFGREQFIEEHERTLNR
jgi:glycosyltransferase involved in cell wall biosynthesis